jgi:2-keto-4-pentenoate hydratase/2-oxohepta-3-ene-1,7-dioic acid hydratase in catechol pathway
VNAIVCHEKSIYPSKVVCIGRNYVEHIKELNNEVPQEMVFFLKPNSSISDTLTTPKNGALCHYEAEISFLIEENKISAVAFGLDLTLREIQTQLKQKGLPWERAKAFDKSAVFSPFTPLALHHDDEINSIEVKLFINEQLIQHGNIEMMIHQPKDIIKQAQTFLSFEDGDILMTGTPSGVGKLQQGDIFLGQILKNNKIIIQKEWKVQ